jgi:hypothetical protein
VKIIIIFEVDIFFEKVKIKEGEGTGEGGYQT